MACYKKAASLDVELLITHGNMFCTVLFLSVYKSLNTYQEISQNFTYFILLLKGKQTPTMSKWLPKLSINGELK